MTKSVRTYEFGERGAVLSWPQVVCGVDFGSVKPRRTSIWAF